MFKRRRKITYSRTSPRGDRRGCLCPDGRTYSTKCCNGSLQAQGIGNITKDTSSDSSDSDSDSDSDDNNNNQVYYLLQEDSSKILQENNDKIIL